MDDTTKTPLQIAMQALDDIALAGMSGSGQESEEGMRDWHARRAWDFIAIAARAKTAIAKTPPVALPAVVDAEAVTAIGFSPMWLAPIDGTPVLLHMPTCGTKFSIGQFHSEGPDTIFGNWGDDEGNYYVHKPAGWMSLRVLERLATHPARASASEPCPNCRGSEFVGFKRGLRCATCDGTGIASASVAGASDTLGRPHFSGWLQTVREPDPTKLQWDDTSPAPGASESLQAMADNERELGLGYETGAIEELPALADSLQRLRDSIAWLRDGKPHARGIGVADMVVIEAALSKPAGQGDGEAVPAGFWLAPMELDAQTNVDATIGSPRPIDDHDVREVFRAVRDSWLARHPQTLVHADVERDEPLTEDDMFTVLGHAQICDSDMNRYFLGLARRIALARGDTAGADRCAQLAARQPSTKEIPND